MALSGEETITLLANTGMCTPDLGDDGLFVLIALPFFSAQLRVDGFPAAAI